MNISRVILSAFVGLGLLEAAQATNRYVSLTGANAPPYTNWADAAANIQLAISACSSGDVVWVTNGVYDAGGVTNWPAGSALTTRVAITTAYITVRSANNDPAHTIIKGAWDPVTTNGPAATRCVYMVGKTSLIGFTLTNGATLLDVNDPGGGVRAPNKVPIISNCVIVGNSSHAYGAGVGYCTLYNCTLRGNSIWRSGGYGGGQAYGDMNNCLTVSNLADNGGGAAYCILYNCKVIGNRSSGTFNCTGYNCLLAGNKYRAFEGDISIFCSSTIVGNGYGASKGSYMYNCIIYSNTVNYDPTYAATISSNCCSWPTQANWKVGDGNITNNPMFVVNGSGYGTNHVPGDYRLSPVSPCMNAGTNFAWMTNAVDLRSKDLDGQKRIQYGTVDMGAYERLNQGTVFGAR